MQTDGELAKHQPAGLQGAADREVSNSATNKPLDAHGRGAQGTCDTCDKSAPWICNTLSSQKSTLLKITLNDFQAFYY